MQLKVIINLLTMFLLLLPLGCSGKNDGKITSLKQLSASNSDVLNIKKMSNPKLVIKTNKGDVTIELFAKEAPISTENFLQYVKKGLYNGTVFHRVIKNFMIQGGGLNNQMQKVATMNPIKNEAFNQLQNLRGTLAMARTGIPDSATNQFFINVVDNHSLDHKSKKPNEYGYAVFGKVVGGMDIVDVIRNVPTTSKSGRRDVPVAEIIINEIVKI